MKKLLLTMSVIFSLVSCENKTRIKDYRGKENIPTPYINHFEYKGHDYIFFDTGEGKWAVGGVVHDPYCRCNTNKEEQP